MRFMLIVKADHRSEAGVLPTEKELAEMGKFNEEMVNSGVMLAGEGCRPAQGCAGHVQGRQTHREGRPFH